jgi:hypothetical protein
VLCDAHVHIYDCFDIGRFLDSAWSNFQITARDHGCENSFSAALMLSESRRDHWFARLTDAAVTGHSPASGWTFHTTSEPETLLARSGGDREIHVIAGRQVVTSENLEVLALATTDERPDGEPVTSVVDWVLDTGGIPVIPWGFGKWWGTRGQILSRLLESSPRKDFFLGDNSGRPWCLGKPRHFRTAAGQNRRILPGSDPLPFPTEDSRAGSVGFFYQDMRNSSVSARVIRTKLFDPKVDIGTYMQCESLLPFMRNQIAMQLRKRSSS